MTAASSKATIEQAPPVTASANAEAERHAPAGSTRTLMLLAGVVLLGGIARFWNLDWDAGYYTLHPDEWALNQVVERLGPDLNPHFFFYGSFPIYLYRATAELLRGLTGVDWLDTSRISLIGRFYSALESTLMLPLIFLVGRRLLELNRRSAGRVSGRVRASFDPGSPLRHG